MKNSLNWIALFFITGGFTGFVPRWKRLWWIFKRPGRGGGLMGSIVALIIQMLFLRYSLGLVWMLIVLAFTFLIARFFLKSTEYFFMVRWGPSARHTGKIVSWDFNETNIDEIIGQLVAGIGVFMVDSALWIKVAVLLVAFVLFRYLDDKKPWGIGKVENYFTSRNLRTQAIIYDDVAAGLYVFPVGIILTFLSGKIL